MGTWALPSEKQKIRLAKKLSKLRVLQEQIKELVGDDILFDHMELTVDRLEKFCTHVTMECKHIAVYEDGVEGWCKLCREKANQQ